jgi:hypothetical protein
MFKNCNKKLKYCIDDSKKYNFIEQLKDYEKNCKDICITFNLKKYIVEKNLCIDNCQEIEEYKYEYNNICYKDENIYIYISGKTNDITGVDSTIIEVSDITEVNTTILRNSDITHVNSTNLETSDIAEVNNATFETRYNIIINSYKKNNWINNWNNIYVCFNISFICYYN